MICLMYEFKSHHRYKSDTIHISSALTSAHLAQVYIVLMPITFIYHFYIFYIVSLKYLFPGAAVQSNIAGRAKKH